MCDPLRTIKELKWDTKQKALEQHLAAYMTKWDEVLDELGESSMLQSKTLVPIMLATVRPMSLRKHISDRMLTLKFVSCSSLKSFILRMCSRTRLWKLARESSSGCRSLAGAVGNYNVVPSLFRSTVIFERAFFSTVMNMSAVMFMLVLLLLVWLTTSMFVVG